MLKLADLVFRGADESPPKVTIHIPRTPVVDMPPVLPSPTLSSKAGAKTKRQLKVPLSGKAATGNPSPLASTLAKIKIPSGVSQTETVVSPAAPPPPEPNSPPPKQAAPKKAVAFAPPKAKTKLKAPLEKQEKLAPQAPPCGMSVNDYRACRNALKRIQANKHARLFAQPVDPVRDNAPK